MKSVSRKHTNTFREEKCDPGPLPSPPFSKVTEVGPIFFANQQCYTATFGTRKLASRKLERYPSQLFQCLPHRHTHADVDTHTHLRGTQTSGNKFEVN